MENENASMPEKKFVAGSISATVWTNYGKTRDGEEISYRSVTLQRKMKNEKGEWESTNIFRLNDVPKAVLVLDKAFEYLAQIY